MKRIFLTLTLLATTLVVHAQSWTNRYDGPENGDDYPNAIALDSNGHVFVTGQSQGGGGVGSYFATIKYSSAGVPLWTNRYKPVADGGAAARAITVDTNGNVFVTGESYLGTTTVTTPSDYTTIKYSSAGVPLWTNRYNGPGNNSDWATAVAVDAAGNLFVTGTSWGGDSGFDFATLMYSNAGVPLWTNRYSGQGGQWDQQWDQAVALAVDGNGNVVVTGSSQSGGGRDYATIKYSSTGVPLWTNLYSEFFGADNYPSRLVVDGSGTVFVTGATVVAGPEGFSLDYGTLAYSGDGVPLWTNLYSGPGNSYDWAGGIALDGGGNVFVTGSSGDPSDYVTIKYSGAGVALWTNRYDGPENASDEAWRIKRRIRSKCLVISATEH